MIAALPLDHAALSVERLFEDRFLLAVAGRRSGFSCRRPWRRKARRSKTPDAAGGRPLPARSGAGDRGGGGGGGGGCGSVAARRPGEFWCHQPDQRFSRWSRMAKASR